MTPRRVLLLYAALALATAFYPAFRGLLPVPAGNAVLLLPDPRMPAVRNDELSDVPMQFVPWTQAVSDAYRSGRLPLRLAANGCGVPLWSNPQAQAVTPTTLFALLMPLPWAFACAAAVKLWLAAVGAFWFIRWRSIGALASFWGGLAYGFAIHMTAWIHYPDTWPAALLPWTLVALERLARGLPGGFLGTVAVVFLLLLGGYPETEFFVALAGAVFFLFALGGQRVSMAQRSRRAGLSVAGALLALALTGAYTLPAALTLVHSERSVQVARSIANAGPTFQAGDLLEPPTYWTIARFWLIPEAQGNPRDLDKFGPYSFAGRASGYAGILIVAFALASFFRRHAPRAIRWARPALLGLGLYVLWYPPLVYVLQATPFVGEIASRLTTNRANCIAVLLLALLAAWELDALARGARVRATQWGVGLALAGCLLVLAEYARTAGRPPLTAWRAMSFALPILLLTGVFVVLALTAGAARRRALALLLLCGTSVDLLKIGARFNPGTSPRDYFPATPKVQELQSASHGGRFSGSDGTLSGMAYMYGLEDVRVHGVAAPAAYADVLQATVGYTGPAEYPSRVMKPEAPFLDFLDTRARLLPGGRIVSVTTTEGVFPDRILGMSDPAELRARLSTESGFLHSAFLVGAGESFLGNAEILSLEKPTPEEIRVHVRSSAPRVLVLPISDDGGWSAEANAQPLPTFLANGAFLAIRVPAGETRILCRYLPPGFRQGLAISALAAALSATLAIRRRGRANSAEQMRDRVRVVGKQR
ncbi:MAG: YfhO family protein [Acidobacteriota bacterium]